MVSAADVQAAQSGSHDAFGRLITQTKNVTTSIALSIVRDLDASEDVAQQVYIKVWQQLSQLQNPQSFLPWLRQITRYTAANYLRDNKVANKLSADDNETLLAKVESQDDDALSLLDKHQTNQMLTAFIDALPNEHRELVLLYYREEQSSKQVAQLLDISESNVRQRLSRVRQSLKQDWMAKYGKVAFSTAPSAGFSIFILNALSTSAPAAAASLATTSSVAKSGTLANVLVLIGGSFIGALFAIAGVIIGNKLLLNNIKDTSFVPMLKRYRNWMIAWIAFTGVLLTISYELTSGWWAPVLSYTVFAIGLVRLIEVTQMIAMQAGLKKSGRFCMNTEARRPYLKIINWVGPSLGGVSMLIGLYNSGRFML